MRYILQVNGVEGGESGRKLIGVYVRAWRWMWMYKDVKYVCV